MRGRLHYGIDSPAKVLTALAGGACSAAAIVYLRGSPHLFGIFRCPLWVGAAAVGIYHTVMAIGMLHYSLCGKLRLRDRLLRSLSWSGHVQVLDVGCGRGLLLVGAARRATDGRAIGIDRWLRGAISGTHP